eukprot:gene19221-21147_t
MVQILIRSKDAHSEWGLVEFQGVLESKDDVNFNGSYTGDLHFDEKGTPYLIIGHHLLTGKIVDLNKPFAVMKKSTEHKQDQIEIDSMNIDDDYDDCKYKKSLLKLTSDHENYCK